MFNRPFFKGQPARQGLQYPTGSSSTPLNHPPRMGPQNSPQDLQHAQDYHDMPPSYSDQRPADDPTPMGNKERRLYSDKVDSLKRELSAYRETNNTLSKQNDSLDAEKRAAERRSSTLQYENEHLTARRNELLAERNSLNERIRILQNQKNNAEVKNSDYLVKIQNLNNEIDRIRNINMLAKQTNDQLTDENNGLKAEIGLLRVDNESLRKHIVHMEKSDVNPLRDEDHYIQNFCELKSELETWIAKHAKSNAAPALTPAQEDWLLKVLSGLGPCGKASSDFMAPNHAALNWYGNARSRIQLIRHIVAVYIFERILEPFAAGLNQGFSEALKWIEKDILARGFLFSPA